MGTERQAKEVPDDNTYLLCPLSDDEVEAIRAKAYKSREKTLAQERKEARLRKRQIEKRELKERRRLREAGEFVPDPGISCVDDFKEFREFTEAYNDPLLSTQFVRRAFYWQLTREQMQRVVARYHGWEKWSEDPWGSYLKFCEWLDNARDNEMAVWAVNETSKGRSYLVESILKGLGQLDYSKMTEKDLLTQTGYGAACFLHIKNYTGWDDFLNHYPKQPLPVGLVNGKVSKVYPFDFKLPCSGDGLIVATKADGSLDIPERVPDPGEIIDFFSMFIDARNYGPFTSYRFLISGIYLRMWAILGANERALEHLRDYLTLESLLNYSAATNTQLADLCQKLGPKDYRLPDMNESWRKLEKPLEPLLERTSEKYKRIFSLRSEVDGHSWEQYYVEAQNALLETVNSWRAKDFIVDGLKGNLLHSLQERIEDYLKNAARKEHPWREVPESTFAKPGDRDRPLDWLTHKKVLNYRDEMDSTDQFKLDLDKLSPTELRVVLSAAEGYDNGYRLFSKKHKSYKQWWGKDYAKNMKALRRAGAKITKS